MECCLFNKESGVAFSKQTIEKFILPGLLLQVLVTIERPQQQVANFHQLRQKHVELRKL